jgi:hypothetical protein
MKRKLSVVMVIDGATSRSGSKTAGRDTGALLSERLVAFDGRVFNVTGSTTLVEFTSSVEAVRCALSLVSSPQATDPAYRFGISVGDVVDDGGNLFGDVVNVAARLAGIAGGGEIYVTRSVFEQAGQHVTVDRTDLGPRQLKNIRNPVDVVCLQPAGTRVEVETKQTSDPSNWLAASLGAAMLCAALIVVVVLWPRGTATEKSETARDAPGSVPASASAAPVPLAGTPTEPTAETLRARRQERCREILERVQSGLASAADRRELADTCR